MSIVRITFSLLLSAFVLLPSTPRRRGSIPESFAMMAIVFDSRRGDHPMNLNLMFVLGRLTADPDLRALPSGVAICTFGVATNRVYYDKEGKKQEEPTFHNVVAFGKTAESVAQYMKKGRLVFVQGSIRTRSWEKDGQKHVRSEVVAERIQFGPKAEKREASVEEIIADPAEASLNAEPTVVL